MNEWALIIWTQGSMGLVMEGPLYTSSQGSILKYTIAYWNVSQESGYTSIGQESLPSKQGLSWCGNLQSVTFIQTQGKINCGSKFNP